MSDDRDDRSAGVDDALRDRFDSSSSEGDSVTSRASKTPSSAKKTKTSNTSKTPISERETVLFYLRDELTDKLDLVEDEVRLTYKREYGVELELNRHIRPLVLRFGIETVVEMDAKDIRDTLRENDVLDDPPTESTA